MDEDGLPVVGAAVDLNKVTPIDFKRTLAFLNHFICHTMNFLNKFSAVCETKLEDVGIRIQRLETSLSILEAKLASIPGLEDVSLISTINSNETETTTFDSTPHVSTLSQTESSSATESSPATDSTNIRTMSDEKEAVNEQVENSPKDDVSNDKRYAKYLKMIQVGVPAMALRPKMIAEGLNPDLLINSKADASSPRKANVNGMGSDSGHSDSSSTNSEHEFSD